MKVVVVMEALPLEGGGFYQALNAVLQAQRLCAGRHDFAVAITDLASKPTLERLGITPLHFPLSLYERWLPILLGSRLLEQVLTRLTGPSSLERGLRSVGADLVYFVSPWWRARIIRQLPYWVTVWDLAHLDFPEFPEVRRPFHSRERVLQRSLETAALVLSDSTELSQQIGHRYGISPSRVVAMPFAPAFSLSDETSASMAETLQAFALQTGYFFYPASFWAHKNHIRILESLRVCADRGTPLRVVFAGIDGGQLAHVQQATRTMGVQEHVRFLGYVEPRHMRALYLGSRALVMPTYFGPTNLPPLEAWSLGVPVIYSSHLHDQAGDAALLADPDNAVALADCMIACLDDKLCADLVLRGTQRLLEIGRQREQAESALVERLWRLEARLRCSA